MVKILIIEDEDKIARFIELELVHEGYEVDKAQDGRVGAKKRSLTIMTLSCWTFFSPN